MGRSKQLLFGVLALAGAFVAVGAPAPAPAAETPQVLMVDNEPDLTRWHYDPAAITVPAGTTVSWFNKGKEEHSVTADDKSFDSGLKKAGGTFSRAFPKPGKYAYHCAPHPWMKGTVEVVASRTAAAAAPAGVSTTVTTAPAPVTTTPTASAPAATAPAPGPESTTTVTEPPAAPSPGDQEQGNTDENAAPASNRKGSGDPLAGTLALVLLPTLAALALGAKLRQSRA